MRASSPARRGWLRFRRRPTAVAGLLVLVAFTLAAIGAPAVADLLGVSVAHVDLPHRLAPPSLAHPLGTDEIGRDVLLRLLYGGRISLTVAAAGALGAAVIGTAIGLIAGWWGGRLDALLMRGTDAVIALPLLPVLIVLSAVDLTKLGIGADAASDPALVVWRVAAIVALFGWTTVARLVRAQVRGFRAQPFVAAARALGGSSRRIILVHLLPNTAPTIIVATTLTAGHVILVESVLSFLGLGIQPPVPSWGNLLTNAQELVWEAPGLALWPGVAIVATVTAINFLGDGLNEVLDPRSTAG